MIRLLLVDDQTIIRQGLRGLLESKAEFQVVGEAENGQQAIAQTIALQPDVVLMDIRMPVMDGVAATREICQQFAQINVLVLTTFDDDDYLSQAMRAGAKGYLLKDTPLEELALAIQAVQKGYTQMGPGLLDKMLTVPIATPPMDSANCSSDMADLSPREQEVLQLIASGASNREIGAALHITERTVKNHVTRILNRLHLRDRTQAAIFVHSFPSSLDSFK
jgi:DNA-binding NarL/FixJ family response regulator